MRQGRQRQRPARPSGQRDLRVDPTLVAQLKADLRALTRIYRAVPTEDTPEAVAAWVEARQLFAAFRQRIDTMTYKQILAAFPTHKQSELPYPYGGVLTTGWDVQLALSGLFQDAWDYRTDEHLPAPWRLKREREPNIRRYQKAFRGFVESLDDLIAYHGRVGTPVPVFPEPYTVIEVAGVSVKIENKGARDTDLDAFLHSLRDRLERVRAVGLGAGADGLSIVVSFDRNDMVAGQYQPAADMLTMFPLGLSGRTRGAGSTLIHEIGHRFYFRVLSPRARGAWDARIEAQLVVITPAAVRAWGEALAPMYQTPSSERWRFNVMEIAAKATSPEQAAQFRYLAKHHPAYAAADTAAGLVGHHQEFSVGEAVAVEHITDYGATNPHEAFAEAFRLYVLRGPRALGPWTRSFFERIVRAGRAAQRRR